eukprot:CAMPEP_0195117552 /NCGR_PEP_ID=MMETSP0448-20130528/114614_1 /TAXON_ID=66468 /ORGANISM="Heterocapsa triquestra, Strain CCMP 448" /LENGTH=56 /DNA_ID=CAMNT_0040154775 /DNA_START=30 /DNA_END=200 /DNA_ORIENTATION=+
MCTQADPGVSGRPAWTATMARLLAAALVRRPRPRAASCSGICIVLVDDRRVWRHMV